MKILVTGGAGYIGSHTIRELTQHGYDVVVLDSLERGYKQAVLGAKLMKGRHYRSCVPPASLPG